MGKVCVPLQPRLTVITLGVKDFRQSLRFYKNGLGWPTSATEEDSIAFFPLSGVVLALYPKSLLAADAMAVPGESGSGFCGITLAHNVEDESAVAMALKAAETAGAKIVKPAQKTFWGGYSGYFADPDDYLWEVAYNPHWILDVNGLVQLS